MTEIPKPIHHGEGFPKIVKNSVFEKTHRASDLAKEMRITRPELRRNIRELENLLESIYQKKEDDLKSKIGRDLKDSERIKPPVKKLFNQAMWNVYMDFIYDQGLAQPPATLPKGHPWYEKDIRDELNELRGRSQ